MIKVVCIEKGYTSSFTYGKIYEAEKHITNGYYVYDNCGIDLYSDKFFITLNEWVALERERKINEILQ